MLLHIPKTILRKILSWLDISTQRFRLNKIKTEISADIPKEISELIENNTASRFKRFEALGDFEYMFKYVGLVAADNEKLYGITNGGTDVLEINPTDKSWKRFGTLPDGEFKWTNGCFYKGFVYGYPRRSNHLLKIDPNTHETELINLDLNYTKEHHYSGVLVGNTVYQPPRNTDHILCINLDNYSTFQIPLGREMLYNGAIYHYNGLVYLFPGKRGDKVMVLNPQTKAVSYIGSPINCSVYGASTALNGCIYGFGGSGSYGILKINPSEGTTTILHKNVSFGAYGSQIGVDGKIYTILGAGITVYALNPNDETITKVARYSDKKENKAKCAGCAVAKDGTIWCVPAFGKTIHVYSFETNGRELPSEVLLDRRFCSY